MKTYFTDDKYFPEYLYWQGGGYYASRQRGSHEKQHIETVFCGGKYTNIDDMRRANRRIGYGTAKFLIEPYGELIA